MDHEHIWNLIAKKLSGEASEEELSQLADVLKKNPDLHYPMQTITDLWKHDRHSIKQTSDNAFSRHISRMDSLNIDFDIEKLNAEQNNYSEPDFFPIKKRRKIKTIFVSVFTILIIALAIIKYIVPNFKEQSATLQKNLSEISTHNGSKTNVVLPDGTIVKLNAGSQLTYDKEYGNTIREVNLTGEAFFEVVKNKEKPFIIHTKKINIKVLGTTFNVKSYPNEKTETSLVKGSIEITFKDNPNKKVILKPNEKLIVADKERPANFIKTLPSEPAVAISHLNYTRKDSTIIETAWVQNKLVFKNETFKELALQMERWYDISIRFNNPGMENLQFTGTFENETVQQALNALQLSAKFNYSIKDNEIEISK